MIYKGYQTSLSTYEEGKTLHIARDAMGVVRFREETEAKLIKAIDRYLEQKEKEAELAAKATLKRKLERQKKQKRGLFAPSLEPEVEEKPVPAEEESILVPSASPQESVKRGPDGK